jgi:hypothetical protein
MFILFEFAIKEKDPKTTKKEELNLTEDESKVMAKLFHQLDKAGITSEKLKNLGDKQISIYAILTEPEKKIAERAFSKLGFKVEFSDNVDKAYSDLWEECKNKHQDNIDAAIDEFVERANINFATTAYIGKEKPREEKKKGDNTNTSIVYITTSAKDLANQLSQLENKARTLGKQINEEAKKHGVVEKTEEPKEKQEEKKEEKQTKDQFSLEGPFKVGNIDFNKVEDNKGKRKLNILFNNERVKYKCKGQSLIDLQNALTEKFKDYDFTLFVVDKNGQKREVSKLSESEKNTSQNWTVTLEYKKKGAQISAKKEEPKSQIDLSTNESYKWLESKIFSIKKGKQTEISPKLLKFKNNIENGVSEFTMDKFKSSLDVDTIKENFQAIANKYGYSMEFIYMPDSKNAGLHEFTIKFTKKDETSSPPTNVQTSTSTATGSVQLSTYTVPTYNIGSSTQTATNWKGSALPQAEVRGYTKEDIEGIKKNYSNLIKPTEKIKPKENISQTVAKIINGIKYDKNLTEEQKIELAEYAKSLVEQKTNGAEGYKALLDSFDSLINSIKKKG